MSGVSGQAGLSAAQGKLDAPDVRDVFKGRTLGVAMVGDVLVIAHDAQPPAQEEWARYCELISRYLPTLSAQFVLAEGPGPNATQRQQSLNRGAQGAVIPPTVVLTRSAMVRGIVTLFNWFTPRAMRALPPEDLQGAALHLKMPDEQIRRLMDVAQALLP
jgi:hypothetical protein